jgi:hypothetical protein
LRNYHAFLLDRSSQALAKTVIRQEMGYRETVSLGRYMKWAGRFMLKLLLDVAFRRCFAGAETAFFLGKNYFQRGLWALFVPVFEYGA